MGVVSGVTHINFPGVVVFQENSKVCVVSKFCPPRIARLGQKFFEVFSEGFRKILGKNLEG